MTEPTDISALMAMIGAQAKKAAAMLAHAPADQKNNALLAAADQIEARSRDIRDANARDLDAAKGKELGPAKLDRLTLDAPRIAAMSKALRDIAAQHDPVGEVMAQWEQPSGLRIRRVRVPLGVIGIIYESRPNVTADAGALCLKSGNAAILRGGSESLNSSRAIHEALVGGIVTAGLPADSVQLVPTADRAAVREMLGMTNAIDVIIPRGGKDLVGLVQSAARVPVFSHLEGIVHVYVDLAADPVKALDIVLNAKTRRTGICGAAECLLIHRDIVDTVGQGVIRALVDAGVEVRADAVLQEIPGTVAASDADWGCEYLDMKIAARAVDDLDDAITHIRTHGSSHTDCIITEDMKAAERFMTEVDSAIVMHNASTQFADGGEFGMGAEIGIATGKLHARGPIGAAQLTSFKYLVEGNGTTRD